MKCLPSFRPFPPSSFRTYITAGILALLWFTLAAVPVTAQVTYQFDHHELSIINWGYSSDCGMKVPPTSPVKQTVGTASGTTSLDGTQFSCPTNITLVNPRLELNFPLTLVGTSDSEGKLTLSSAVTPSAALKGTWTWTWTPSSAAKASIQNGARFVQGGCDRSLETMQITVPGSYVIPDLPYSSCTINALWPYSGYARIESIVKSIFSSSVTGFSKSTGPEIKITTFYAPKADPLMTVYPTSLDFGTVEAIPEAKTIVLTNSGVGAITWKADLSMNGTTSLSAEKLNADWFAVQPTSGTLAQGASVTLNVTVIQANLVTGSNSGKIVISSPEAKNSPQEVSVKATAPESKEDSLVLSEESPKEGTILTEESTQGFSAKVKCTLGTKPTAQLSLRVFSVLINKDEVLQSTSDLVNVSRSEGTKEITMTIPAFRIAKGTIKLKLLANLIYSGTVLTSSYAITYIVRTPTVKIQSVNVYWGDQKTNRFNSGCILPYAVLAVGGKKLKGTLLGGYPLNGSRSYDMFGDNRCPEDLAIVIQYDLSGNKGMSGLLFNEWRYNQSGQQDDLRTTLMGTRKATPGMGQQEVYWIPGDHQVQTDADGWQFEAYLDPLDGGGPIKANSLSVLIQRLRILPKSYTPKMNSILEKGKTVDFSFDVEYNNPANATLEARVSPSGWYPLKYEQKNFYTIADTTKRSDNHGVFTWKFQYVIPGSTSALALAFSDENSSVMTEIVLYMKLLAASTTIPSTSGQTASASGLDIKTVQNRTDRKTDIIHVVGDIASINMLNPTGSNLHAISEADDSSRESGTTADPFQDFLGINAYWQIDPSIPSFESTSSGSGFNVFDVTLHYSAEDLPDDPNFEESQLKIVSFDGTTAKLTAYNTTVDTANKTLTARVTGLGPYLSAGVFGPFTRQNLDFPILRSTDTLYNGIGLLNLGKETATLSLTAYSEDGSAKSGTGVTNPATASLVAGGQVPKLAQELFNFSAGSNNGWVQVRSDKNTVVGFELIGSDTVLDGVDGSGTHAQSVVLTDIEYDTTTTTEIQIANPTNFPVSMTLALHADSPTAVGSLDIALMPKEKICRRIQDLFPSLANPFLGYLIANADHNIVAAEMLNSATSIAMLNAQTLVTGSFSASRLYSAQLAHGGDVYYTQLNIVNPTSLTADLVIRAVNESGGTLAPPVSISLGPGRQYLREVGQMFGLSSASLLVGSLMVESSITGVVGDISFGDPSDEATFRTSLPLDKNPSKFAAFAQVANGAGYFTGFAAFNPSSMSAAVDLKIYKSDGTSTGSTRFTLPAGGRLSKLLPEMVPVSEGQVGGYFTLSADQAVTSFAVFGTTSLSALSAVPPLGRDLAVETSTSATCNLFSESFDGPTASGWTTGGSGTWQVTGGKYEVSNMGSSNGGESKHALPIPNYFRLTMDVEATDFNGYCYGFEPYSDSRTFTINTAGGNRRIDGLGAAVNGQGQVGFLGYDLDAKSLIILNAADYGSVHSLGVEWTGTGITLLVNGTARQTIPATSLGLSSIPAPSLEWLGLYAYGNTSRIRFDNLCQKTP